MIRTIALLGVVLSSASAFASSVVCNTNSITIPDSGTASLYPSSVTVSGAPSFVRNVVVIINGFSHTRADDVGIVLQGPTGVALLLQDGAGGSPDWINAVYSISDFSGSLLPVEDAVVSGVFRATAYFVGDPFPAPGPVLDYGNPGPANGATATLASTFNGSASNGTWKLFVVDFVAGESGSISNGWCIAINDVVFANAFGF